MLSMVIVFKKNMCHPHMHVALIKIVFLAELFLWHLSTVKVDVITFYGKACVITKQCSVTS